MYDYKGLIPLRKLEILLSLRRILICTHIQCLDSIQKDYIYHWDLLSDDLFCLFYNPFWVQASIMLFFFQELYSHVHSMIGYSLLFGHMYTDDLVPQLYI